MKVLLIGKDNIRGGSSKCLNVLETALVRQGHQVRMLLGKAEESGPNRACLPAPSLVGRAVFHAVNLLGLNFAGVLGTLQIAEHPFFREADVVHYHNLLGGYFNYLRLPSLTQAKPSVWTLHDMWALTGHCIHSFDCQRWRTGCGACPYPSTDPPIRRDATAWEWRLKQRTYRRSRMVLTTPSRWQFNLLGKSMLRDHPARHVPNAVDTSVYRAVDRAVVRRELGWPQESFVVLLASNRLGNPFQRFDLLPEIFAGIRHKRPHGVTIAMLGEPGPAFEVPAGISMFSLGYLDADRDKARVFAAADVLLFPSRADNQPLILLEAMSCGCPAVAFDVGGISELVRHRETGYLARSACADDMRSGLQWLMDHPEECRRLGTASRRLVEANHDLDQHALSMLNVYYEAIQRHV